MACAAPGGGCGDRALGGSAFLAGLGSGGGCVLGHGALFARGLQMSKRGAGIKVWT